MAFRLFRSHTVHTLSLPELQNKTEQEAEIQSAHGFHKTFQKPHSDENSLLIRVAMAGRQAAGGPDHGAAVGAEGESGDGAVVALQDAHALAGAQVPQPDAAVQGGGEELQAAGVGVELHQAATARRRHFSSELLLR